MNFRPWAEEDEDFDVTKHPGAYEEPNAGAPTAPLGAPTKAFSDDVLDHLAKTNPDLIAKYRESVSGAEERLGNARDLQDYGSIANVFGKGLQDLANANSRQNDVILHNSIGNLGKAPTIEGADHRQFDPSVIAGATSRNLARAKEERGEAESSFWTQEKLADLGQSRADAGVVRDDAQRARAKALREADPLSEESASARAYLKHLVPSAGSIENFDSLSAAQVAKVAPGLFDKYKLDEQVAQRKQDARDRAADRAEARAARDASKADDRAWKEDQTRKANEEKKKTLLNEIEDRRTNIQQNIDILDKMIEENGTYETLGSHNQDMERLVDQIATDMAKLQDPSSVARPSEVELVKKSLIQPGFRNSNATARDILKNFKGEVDRRADGAYAIRNIEKPGAGSAAGKRSPDSRPKTIIQNGHTYTLNESTGEYE